MRYEIFYQVSTGIKKQTCDDSALLGTKVVNGGCGSFQIEGDANICVSDGVGGNAGGDEASLFLMNHLKEMNDPVDSCILKERLISINERLLQYAGSVAGHEAMAAAFSGLFFRKDHVLLAHCGNTRVYALQGSFLKQLTEDQTTYQWLLMTGNYEAAEACSKSEIRGAFGGGDTKYLDTLVVEEVFERGIPGMILLTTDGIHDVLDIDEIEEAASSELNPARKADRLIAMAREKGSQDDCTVVFVKTAD